MALAPFAVPYAPNLVPIPQLGSEPTEQIKDLTRYLQEEFLRVQTALQFVPVQAAYGAILVSPGPAPDQPLDGTPTGLTGFNNFSPDNPNRIATDLVSLAGDSLTPEEGGVYLIQAQVAADIDSGTTYTLSVAINGVVADVFGVIDASNQTDIVTIVFYGIVELDQGDLVTLVGQAAGAGPGPFEFIMLSATFSLIRISEFHGRDAASVP